MGTTHTRQVRFEGAQGHVLEGRLELPSQAARAYALFAHCFTCSKDYLAPKRIGQALAEGGIAVLRFDFTGLGASQGAFSETGFSSNVADIVHAAGFLRRDHAAPAILIGHSLGGAATLAAAVEIPESRLVATIAAPSEPAQLKEHLTGVIPEIERQGAHEVKIAGRPFTLTRRFLEDLTAQDLGPVIRGLGRALMVFHSPLDEVVGIDHGERIFPRHATPRASWCWRGRTTWSRPGRMPAISPMSSPPGPGVIRRAAENGLAICTSGLVYAL
jgi:putative redox protein